MQKNNSILENFSSFAKRSKILADTYQKSNFVELSK